MKRSFLLITLFSIFAFSLVNGQSNQQKDSKNIPILKGRVTDARTGKPIKGARVIVGNFGATTDKNGNYQIKLFRTPDGSIFSVRVIATNYEDNWYPGMVANVGQALQLNVALKKKQHKEKRIFKLRYQKPTDVIQAISLPGESFGGFSASDKYMTIAVMGYPETLAKLDSLIKTFDVPLKKIWLEVRFIRALQNEQEKPYFSKEIKGIASKLSSLFKFRQYYLAGQTNAVGIEGEELKIETSSPDSTVSEFKVSTTPRYANGVIKLEDLNIQFWWRPRPFLKSPDSDLQTTLNLKSGETIILGASQGNERRGAIISVVTAKVVD